MTQQQQQQQQHEEQQGLWPPPPPHPHHLHHLLLPSLSLMGQHSAAASSPPAASSASAAAVEEKPKISHPDPPPSAAPSAATTKIPFRPRKIRKTSSSDDSAAQSDPSKKPLPPSNNNGSRAVAVRVLPRPLSAEGEVAAALRHLRAADPHLAHVIDAHDPPTFQSLHPPFHSLARSILYQQLAFKAAASIYARFLALCGGEAGVVPEAVLALSPQQLRQIGVSGRKASYLHDLARKYHSGILSDAMVVAMDDKSLFTMLTMVKGIGAWSVHMFMIFSLHRPDVLPVGDLGFRKGVQILYGLEDVPRPSQMEQLCERWKPYRSVGAWYMWRLAEAKGAPALASSAGGAAAMTAGVVDGGGALHLQQPQLIDPLQMLPNLG